MGESPYGNFAKSDILVTAVTYSSRTLSYTARTQHIRWQQK
jgi:hypothetical protein